MDEVSGGRPETALPETSAALLRNMPLFGGLDDDELLEITSRLRPRTYKPGEIIVKEGAQASELFIIRKGSVEVFKTRMGRDDSSRIALLRGGDCFGEMALIDIMPRSASVRALEQTDTMTLSYGEFHALANESLKTFTLLVMNIAREISRRLRAADCTLAEYSVAVDDDSAL